MGYLSCKADSAIAIISTTPSSQASSSPSTSTSRTKQEKPIKIRQFNYSDIEAATDGFSDQKLLGKGSHGCVYKAVLRGRHVAVKKPSKDLEIGQEVDNEIEILSKIHSPRFVNLLGFANDTKDRTVPLKDPMIRKQLALIASKCVRSCRERRPAMKEVVDWLAALSKLVPLHSWNGFNNPCMMVETMGRPTELRNTQFGSRPQDDGEEILEGIYGKMGRKSVMDTRRVYSDLGFRSNLMELMAGTDAETDGLNLV
uniref:Serine/threonine-protein kinase-like protein n=1 Tax=Populus alba TaxID=43335 RepID=A0A4U5LSE9_POPAL|nr:serine/threonine-protein kinase-like protein [Populus alba]